MYLALRSGLPSRTNCHCSLSLSSHQPNSNASKSALLQLARSTASEWGPHKIRVNTISPGYIMTAMTAQLIADRPDDKLEERWANDNMMGRVSLPWEYKGPAIFLASDASAFCTGMDLRVDGGHCGEYSFFCSEDRQEDFRVPF